MNESMDKVDVVVLASGVNKIPLYDGYEPGYKALIPFAGRASIHYVLDALDGVSEVGRVCIEGPRALLETELSGRADVGRLTLVDGGESFMESLVIGLKHFSASRRVLFVTADIPLATSDALTDFLKGCNAWPAPGGPALWVSAVPERSYVGPYKSFTKPFNGYRGGRVCHGNVFMADPRLLEIPGLKERIDRFYAGRKSALTTTLALGWRMALVYLLGVELFHLLTVNQMAGFASKQLGFSVIPVLLDHPGVTIDVDEADDYEFVRDRIEATCP